MYDKFERFLKVLEEEISSVQESEAICGKLGNAPISALNELPDAEMKEVK